MVRACLEASIYITRSFWSSLGISFLDGPLFGNRAVWNARSALKSPEELDYESQGVFNMVPPFSYFFFFWQFKYGSTCGFLKYLKMYLFPRTLIMDCRLVSTLRKRLGGSKPQQVFSFALNDAKAIVFWLSCMLKARLLRPFNVYMMHCAQRSFQQMAGTGWLLDDPRVSQDRSVVEGCLHVLT